jgi:hypothetical protein
LDYEKTVSLTPNAESYDFINHKWRIRNLQQVVVCIRAGESNSISTAESEGIRSRVTRHAKRRNPIPVPMLKNQWRIGAYVGKVKSAA